MSEHVIPALGKKVVKEGERSCAKCKFFQPPTPATSWDKPTPGSCGALKSKPVDLTIMTRQEVEASHEMHATGCDAYNSDTYRYDATAATINVGVSLLPDLEIDVQKRGQCTSCLGCINVIPPDEVEKLGFAPGWSMCAAKGNLIARSQVERVARDCEIRQIAWDIQDFRIQSPEDIDKAVAFWPTFNIEAVRKYMNRSAGTDDDAVLTTLPSGYDPESYTSKVSASETAQGLKGWVKLNDPEGTGNSTLLPVFRPDFFADAERAKIPKTGDDEHPEYYEDYAGLLYSVAVGWMELDETPTLFGPPGVGKTELGRHLAWIMQIPLERISITNSSELGDLQGEKEFINNETVFRPGRVVTGWAKPCILLIDEPNVGPRDVWQFLRPLTDNSKQLVVDAWDGQPIKRHDFCFLMLAMNPAWDMKNDGAQELADADIRRLYHLDVPYPEKDVEKRIVQTHCATKGFDIPDTLLESVLEVGAVLRGMADQLPISWGIGQQIKVAMLLNWFGPVAAYLRAGGNYLEPSIRDLFLTEVLARFEKG